MSKYSFGAAVFPDGSTDNEKELFAYIDRVYQNGGREIFSSLHIPELTYEKALPAMQSLGRYVRGKGMMFSLDISGGAAKKFLGDNDMLCALKGLAPDWMRLDYGFETEDIIHLARTLDLSGVMLNASMFTPEQASEQVAVLRRELDGIKIRAHHNYYPMPETGLSLEFMAERSRTYRDMGIAVTACVASAANPRLPMRAGLPTVEKHRHMGVGQAAQELLGTGVIDDILIGDPYADESELYDISLCCGVNVPTLHVQLNTELSARERDIAFGMLHSVRVDEAEYFIRSLTSRQMATPGQTVRARECGERGIGDILVMNENALRYSGELVIMKRNAQSSAMFNPIGRVVQCDMWKLELLTAGRSFKLVAQE